MKLSISKYAKPIAFIVGLLPVFLTLSCSDVIFDEIRKEVKLSDAVISGDIQNIVRYKDDIYVSTGKISRRSVATADINKKIELKSFSSPDGYIYSLAADSSNLYALSITLEEDDDGYNVPTKRTLWCYNGSSWKSIWSKSYNEKNSAILFCTNSPKPANRHAYFRYTSTVYELTGDKLGETGMKTETSSKPSTVPSTSSRSCALLGSTVYFSSAYAMASNETLETDSTMLYYSEGDRIFYSKDASDWQNADLDCDTIYSIAVTADYILAGTASGIVHTTLTIGVPSSGTADFSTNADSTLSSYYEIPAVLVIDSSKTERGATIFASCVTSSTSASLNNVGLWSYFASEGEWNRE